MKKRILAIVLALFMSVFSLSTNIQAFASSEGTPEIEQYSEDAVEKSEEKLSGQKFTADDIEGTGPIDLPPELESEEVSDSNPDSEEHPFHNEEVDLNKASDMVNNGFEPEDKVTIIVELEKESLLDAGYTANQIQKKATAVLHEASQERHIDKVTARMEKELKDEVETLYEYKVAITGMAITTEYKNLEKIKNVKGVKDAWISPVYQLSDVDTNTSNGSSMIGADIVWNKTGYTGKGMKVAIIDTGLDVNHDSFKPLSEDKLTETSMDSSDVEEVWKKLNASKDTVRPIGVYRNTKVPYAYNYVTKSYDVAHPENTSDHGTHVAGIAAANKIDTTDVVGIAPDAQIVVMQVFSPQGGADFANVLAAMEDAVYLNVDIMNLSLGSASGFADSDENVNTIFDRFADTDIQVAIASGNDTHNATQNLHGYNLSLAGNPDIGLVGNPGSYTESMTVASIDNSATKSFTFSVGDKELGYNDTAYTSHTNWLTKMGILKDYEYVWVGEGVYGGDVSDFKNANNGLGVEGKIALVSRGGGVSFLDKQANAGAAGAIACIVYNNTTGVINMQVNDGNGHIPCISVSNTDGEYMVSLLENGVGKLTTGNGKQQTVISSSYGMSEFSSWGVTPSLGLKPDITGVGGNVNSTRNNNTYGLMSGTSMATPQMAGASAIIMQYIHHKLGEDLTEKEIRDLTSALLMSTADPVLTENMEYSPRLQGAGLANLSDAVSTYGYITSNSQQDGRPKAELGDSIDGKYSFSFKINNLTDKPLYYELDSSLLTEGIIKYGEKDYMTSTPVALDSKVEFDYEGRLFYDFNDDGVINSADVRVLLMVLNGDSSLCKRPEENLDVNGDGNFDKKDSQELAHYVAELEVSFDSEESILIVPPSGALDCNATITLSDDEKAYMNEHFENGIFVEGFVYAKSLNGDIENLSMPVMGFYGDWTKPPIIDEGNYYYWQTEGESSLFPTAIFTDRFMLGVNPYIETPFKEEHSAISLKNGLAEFDIGLLRNAKSLTFTVINEETKEEYWRLEEKDIVKSYFNDAYGMIVPYWIANPMSGERILWDGTDAKGNPVAENTKTILKVEAEVDYEGQNKFQSFEMPMWMDNTKPEIVNVNELHPVIEDGKVNLEVSIKDNQYIACILFESPDGSIMAKHAVEDYKPGTTMDYTFDITGFGEEFNIILADYACNELVEEVEIDLGSGWDEGQLPLTKLDINKLYAFESGQQSKLSNGWYSANKNDLSEAANITYANSSKYYSAEYIDGFIYAQNTAGELVVITPRSTYWKENVLNKQSDVNLYDMAFDYSSNTLYAVGWDYRIGDRGMSVLVKVDLYSGTIERVAPLSGMNSDTMTTLACTTEGELYGIDMSGYLNKIPKDKDNGHVEIVGLTDFAKRPDFYGVNVIQSMAYDHNTDTLYWNAYSTKYNVNSNEHMVTNGTFIVDLETAKTTEVGSIEKNCGIGLFIPYDGGDLLPHTVKPTLVEPSENNVSMLPTQTRKLSLKWTPWNAELSPVSWTIENETPDVEGEVVATVDAKGKITAVSTGTATVVAKTTVYPEWAPEGYEMDCKFNVKVLPSTDEMYGFLQVDINDMEKNANTWITFKDVQPTNYEVLTETSKLSYSAAAYYDGHVYAVVLGQENADLYKIKVTKDSETEKATFGEPVHIGSMGKTNIVDMTFDYTTGRMYGIENHQAYMNLSIIDLETGALDKISKIEDIIVALACDGEGNLYGLNNEGVLHTFDSETGEATVVYDTGIEAGNFLQSMTYDYNSGNLYWAQCADTYKSSFYLLSKTEHGDGENQWTDWKTVKLGDVGGKKGAEITGLFTIPKEEPEAVYIPVTGLTIDQGDFSMMEGSKYQLSATTEPKRPTLQRKNWTSDNEDVVIVDSFGMITAVAPGTATITAAITDRESNITYEDTIKITVIESAGNLQAFLNNDQSTSYYSHWISIPDYNPGKYDLVKNTIDAYTLVAGDYYDGYVYAYDTNGILFRIDPETFKIKEIGKHGVTGNNFKILDMTYDYSNFRMLALCTSSYWSNKTEIYSVDLYTGALTKVIDMESNESVYGLAYGNGNYYGVKKDGMICTIDLSNGELTDIVATDNKLYTTSSSYNTTLAYDHNNNRLYMAPIVNQLDEYGNSNYTGGNLYMIDPGAKVAIPLGVIGKSGSSVCSMYMVPEKGKVPEDTRVNGIEISQDALRMATGDIKTLEANVMPRGAANKKVAWKSSDEGIAMVENGNITAKKPGTATITVTTEEGGYSTSCEVTVVDPTQTAGNLAYAFSEEHGGLISFDPQLPSNTLTKLKVYDDVEEILGTAMVDGALYFLKDVANYYPKLYKMELNSYNITEIGYVPMMVGPANDMTYDSFTKMLYITSGLYIYAIDPGTGGVVTSVNVNNRITHGITAVNGYLYVVSNDGSNKNVLSEIDTEVLFNVSNGSIITPWEHFKTVGDLNPMIHTSLKSTMEYDYASRKTYITADGALYTLELNTGKTSKVDAISDLGGMTFKADENLTISVTGVKLNKEEIKLKVGMTQQLIASVSPDKDGANKNVSWKSDNAEVVSVDEDGNVEALAAGTAVITVTTEDGGFTDSCTITVVNSENEKWVYGYSADEKAFIRFDSTMLDVDGEILLRHDAGINGYGEQIYPTGMTYVDGYVYFMQQDAKYSTNLYRWNVEENTIEEFISGIKNIYDDPLYVIEMTSYGNTLYLTCSGGLYTIDISTKAVAKAVDGNDWMGTGLVVIDENNIIGQMGNGRQLTYTRTDGKWNVVRSTRNNGVSTSDYIFSGIAKIEDTIYYVADSTLYTIDFNTYTSNKIGNIASGRMTALFTMPDEAFNSK